MDGGIGQEHPGGRGIGGDAGAQPSLDHHDGTRAGEELALLILGDGKMGSQSGQVSEHHGQGLSLPVFAEAQALDSLRPKRRRRPGGSRPDPSPRRCLRRPVALAHGARRRLPRPPDTPLKGDLPVPAQRSRDRLPAGRRRVPAVRGGTAEAHTPGRHRAARGTACRPDSRTPGRKWGKA